MRQDPEKIAVGNMAGAVPLLLLTRTAPRHLRHND